MAGPESDLPRLLIVDRDTTARGRLRSQLRGLGRSIPVQIVADAGDADITPAAILAQNPQIVLLDVLMPDCTGLAMAREVRARPGGPQVVLIVPSADVASQAAGIDLAACLQRPLRNGPLAEAVRAAVGRLEQDAPGAAAQETRHFLPVLDKGEPRAIPLESVLYLRAELKYVMIRTRDREFLTEEPLSALLHAFPRHFLRVHRNTLVARHAIRSARKVPAGELDPAADAYWELALHEVPERIAVSRRQWRDVKQAVPEVLQ